MRGFLIAAGVAGLALAGATGAAAQNTIICSQPVKPTCMRSDITFELDQRTKRCRRDVEAYVDAVDEYIACLGDKIDAQRQERKRIRETFECRAAGKSDC